MDGDQIIVHVGYIIFVFCMGMLFAQKWCDK